MAMGAAGTAGAGSGSAVIGMETATPSTGDGVETEFTFTGTPILPMCNGVVYSPDAYSVVGTTVTIPIPPEAGRQITALTAS